MEVNKNQQSLKVKWSHFLNILLDPWVIIMLGATIAFISYFSHTEDNNVKEILLLIITLISSLLGGIIANRWAQLTELKVLVARGKSAIRSLKLILLNVSNIEKRTKEYINSIDKDNMEHKLIISNFEEVIEKCNILEEEIISSIENWTDIIPEVENIKTQIGLISDMKMKQVNLEDDIVNLKKQIVASKVDGDKQYEDLKAILNSKEEELISTKQRLESSEIKINTSVLSGLTYTPTAAIINRIPNSLGNFKLCKICGKGYIETSFNAFGNCSNCKPSVSIPSSPPIKN